MATDQKSKEIISGLRSPDPELVLDTLESVRESGNRLIVEEIISLVHSTLFPEVKKSALMLLSELKDRESVPVLIAAIENEKYAPQRAELIACCWQNGLPYNDYLPLFVDLSIHEEFTVAFEAFTVIENMYGRIGDDIINAEMGKLTAALKDANEQKAYLINALLTIIPDIPETQELA